VELQVLASIDQDNGNLQKLANGADLLVIHNSNDLDCFR